MNRSKYGVRQIALFLFGLMIVSASALAANPTEPPLIQTDEAMTLDDLVQLAIDHEYTYRQAVEGERIVGMLRASAIGQFLPTITSNASYGSSTYKDYTVYDDDYTPIGKIDLETSSSSVSFNASESIFEGGSRLWGIKSAKLQLENIFLNTERSRDVLIAQVKTAFYNFLLARENLAVQQEILGQREESLRLARARFQTGDVIELDVMQAEIDLGTQQNTVLQAEQSLQNGREALNLSVGIHLDSTYPVSGDLTPVLPEVESDILVNTALQSRPDFKTAKNAVKINDLAVKTYSSSYLPSLSWNYRYGRNYSNSSTAGDYHYWPEDVSSYAGFSLNWTIFNGFQREYNRQNAVVTKRQSVYNEFAMRQTVMSEVRSEWRSIENLFQQIQVLDRNRDLARRQLTLEQERYRIGASDQLSLRSAQVTFISAENQYLVTVLEYFTTLATLERDLGVSLEEVSR